MSLGDPIYRQNRMVKTLRLMWNFRSLGDLRILTKHGEIPAHSIVLSILSTKIKNYVIEYAENKPCQLITLDLSKFSNCIVTTMLEYIYGTNELKARDDTVVDMLSLAEELGISDVKKIIYNFLENKINVENCILRLYLAEKFDLGQLAEVCINVAADNFQDIKFNKFIPNLSKQAINNLLRMDTLNTENELDVMECISFWYKHKAAELGILNCSVKAELIQDVGDLISSVVRFVIMPRTYLNWFSHPECLPVDFKIELDSARNRIASLNSIVREKSRGPAKYVYQYNQYQKEQLTDALKRNPWKIITALFGGKIANKSNSLDTVTCIHHTPSGEIDLMPDKVPPKLYQLPSPIKNAVAVALPFRVGENSPPEPYYLSSKRIYQIFLCGGEQNENDSLKSTWVFDIESQNWHQGPTFEVNRSKFGLAVDEIGSKVYAIGGSDRSAKQTCEVLNARSPNLEWSQMKETLNEKRYNCSAAHLSHDSAGVECSLLFVIGGHSHEAKRCPEMLDLMTEGQPWTMIKTSYAVHNSPVITTHAGKIWVFGGSGTSVIESFNRRTNEWQEHGFMPEWLHGSAITKINHHAYIIGGESEKEIQSFVKCFNLESGVWCNDPTIRKMNNTKFSSQYSWQNYSAFCSFLIR